jgi:hypothetical protein
MKEIEKWSRDVMHQLATVCFCCVLERFTGKCADDFTIQEKNSYSF